ncbi:MAG: DNA alkylation repair protein [Sulfurimonas sp.]|nr:DNA alkylation repair protein [Sulfurimonas sp.]PHQ92413.1 MAG: DNA alkylation repair protein [Sulfurimonas sp.]
MAPLLKDLYNEMYIQKLCNALEESYTPFKKDAFTSCIFNKEWEKKELKQRMRYISTSLGIYLPQNYSQSIEILKKSFLKLPDGLGLQNMIFQDFVEVYGMDDFTTSMSALECFTINSSSEFAIRQFIIKYPTKTMQHILVWARHENHHIRRLSSEGCRPRLPWAIALSSFKENPQEIINILELLKNDKSAYVIKSLANNLNDISKDNPDIVKNLVQEWLKEDKRREKYLKHASRTLLKASDKDMLNLFGFTTSKNIHLDNFTMNNTVTIGKKLNFSFALHAEEFLGKLRVEFIISFLRKNNKYNKKVFHLSQGTYKTKSQAFSKSYSFKKISTRSYYSGLHELSIQVNGRVLMRKEFTLLS